MIPEIQLGNIDIGIGQVSNLNINVMPDWMSNPPQAIPIYPPVTSQVGIPIVNIPGCVESHRDSNENQTLKEEDKDGVRVFCDAGTPSYSPLDYDPRRLEVKQHLNHLHHINHQNQNHQRHQRQIQIHHHLHHQLSVLQENNS